MKRTTISLPNELLERVRAIAAERRMFTAAVVREALEEKAKDHRPRPRSLGIGASGHSDTARMAGDERPDASIMALVLDTGPLYAALDRDDADHAACRDPMATVDGLLVIPSPVLVEVH